MCKSKLNYDLFNGVDVQINEDGEVVRFVGNEDKEWKKDEVVGIHKYCNGHIEYTYITPILATLYCTKCNLRLIIHKDQGTVEKFKSYYSKK